MEILVVTGMSGAGKSTCLRALEDLGYYCVDNLPVPMLPMLVETKAGAPPHAVEPDSECSASPPRSDTLAALGPKVRLASLGTTPRRFAIGIDARSQEHLHAFSEIRQQLLASGHAVEILFLEAPDSTIVRRFSETRRRHPMGELPDAITRERERLRELRALADSVIDSENLSSRQLRQLVRDRYGTRSSVLHLVLMSFGFKNGLPSEADLVFDARFLQNPFDVPELRAQGGFDAPVREYVLGQADALELLDRIEGWLRFQAPATIREGRSYLTVALGCTGGQHRSVVLIEALGERLRSRPVAEPAPVLTIRHRDLARALADTAHL